MTIAATDLILASQSAARRAMLAAAGVPFRAQAAGVDEDSAKQALVADGIDGRAMADALAELKAIKLSARFPTALVLGCDSTVTTAAGTILDKAADRAEAARQLRALAGATHRLTSAAVVAQGGRPVWRHVDTARLTMRAFSDAFLDSYLDAEWPAIGGCVGGYRLEGLGAQLFSRIEGDHFTILGLPLLPLLAWLRDRGVIAA
jgi:septum formation protein